MKTACTTTRTPEEVALAEIRRVLTWRQVREQDGGVSLALEIAISTMRRYQQEAFIKERSIKIMGYLERNPSALIYRDQYVITAFEEAEKALALAVKYQKEAKRGMRK